MSKPIFAISAPIDTYSGYGARARDIVKSIVKTNKYNVIVLSQRWGNTRFGYLMDHNEKDLFDLITPKLEGKPDYWMQITVPNEFQPVGKYNIGCTAGMETTLVDPKWIEGCNRMDLIITSSEHSKNTFLNSIYELTDNRSGEKNKLKLDKPIEVVFEGLDTSKYFISKSKFDLSMIPESFCFFNIGHWMQGDLGQDRKNIGYLVKAFLETFKNIQNPPALILKSSIVNSSILDRDRLEKKLDSIYRTVKGKTPNVYIIHGEISDEEVNDLYNHPKVKAMVSFTKGEGFGRPLLEFSAVGKPIIASGWSGHMDFLHRDRSILVGGELTNVHQSAAQKEMILKESKWFSPNDGEVNKAFKTVFKEYKKWIVPAKKQKYKVTTDFTLEKMNALMASILDKNLPEFAQQVELTLPKL